MVCIYSLSVCEHAAAESFSGHMDTVKTLAVITGTPLDLGEATRLRLDEQFQGAVFEIQDVLPNFWLL